MSHYMIIFCSLLLTAVDVRAQCDRPSVGENRVLADDVDQQTFSDGSILKFKCSTGYVTLSGSKSITCTGTQWSDLELQCKKRSCGNPGEINNGRYQIPPESGILFGATITATCNDGYQLVGYAKRNCLATGWDGRAPVCEEVKCLPPPSIKDGTFEPREEFYNYGDVVTYSCNHGVDLIGVSELSCSNNGNFQPAPPLCAAVYCDRPEIPHAVRIEGKSPPYKYNNFVRYKCEKDYKMEGSDYLVCKENGWDPSPPQCTVITCLKPPTITNGVFNPIKELYMLKEKVTYDCVEGFKLYGSPTISCTDNGQFETVLPECRLVTCAPPPGINKGQFTPVKSVYEYGQSVTYSCENEKFSIEGAATILCTKDGTFQPPPQCKEVVTCAPPPGINKGQFTPVKSVYEYGQSVTYSCENEKFSIEGAATILCTKDGTFQPPPQCKEVSDPRIWIIVIVLCIIILLLLVVGGYCYYQKKVEREKSTHRSKPETCSLVNVSSSHHSKDETSPKAMY